MTYNTGNPIGSTDPRDLYDNAENLDEAVNSSADTFKDRLGKSRLTWAGIVKAGSGDPAIAVDAAARAEAAASDVEDNAEQIAQDAAEQAAQAAQESLSYASISKDFSESAQAANLAGDDIYPDVISGRQSVADGEVFWVQEGTFLTLYRAETGGLATPISNIGSLGVSRRKNLIGHISDGVTISGGGSGAQLNTGVVGAGSYIIPITGGTVYTVRAEFADRFRISETISFPVDGQTVDFVRKAGDTLGPITFTTDPSSKYMIIYARSAGGPDPVKVQVNEGDQLLEYTDPFSAENVYYLFTEADKSGLGLSALESDVADLKSKTGFIASKNLIDTEKDYTNLYAGGSGSIGYNINAGTDQGSYVCEVAEGVTYTASAYDGDRLIVVLTSSYPAAGMSNVFVGRSTAEPVKQTTFTVSPGYKYALIYVKTSSYPEKPTMVQLEVGEDRTDFTPFNSPHNLYVDLTKVEVKLPETQNGSSIGDMYPLKSQLTYTEISELDVPETLVDDLDSDRDSLDTDYFISKYDALAAAHPQYVTKKSLGLASDGSYLWMYEFSAPASRGDANFRPPKVYVSSLIHGMEKEIGVSTYLFFDMLCNEWQTNDVLGALRLGVDFVVVPVLNPYGTTATSLPGYSGITEARRNANGVDLNRNFPASWTLDPDTESMYYAGPTPASEPETQIIMGLMDSGEIDFQISGHNYGPYTSSRKYSVWWSANSSRVEMELSGLAVTATRSLSKKYPSIYQDVLDSGQNVALLRGTTSPGSEAMQWYTEGINGCLFETSTKIFSPDIDNPTRAGLWHALENTINTVVAGLKCLD